MPRTDGLPRGTLALLILRILHSGPLHGYAVAQQIGLLSSARLSVEEGSLYPALRKLLLEGWVAVTPAVSQTGRNVREYRITPAGRRELERAREEYQRAADAIAAILGPA